MYRDLIVSGVYAPRVHRCVVFLSPAFIVNHITINDIITRTYPFQSPRNTHMILICLFLINYEKTPIDKFV